MHSIVHVYAIIMFHVALLCDAVIWIHACIPISFIINLNNLAMSMVHVFIYTYTGISKAVYLQLTTEITVCHNLVAKCYSITA